MLKKGLEKVIPWEIDEIAKVIHTKTNLFGKITGISTDTRSIQSGNIFLALSGERFDGHEYANLALSKGAKALILERSVEGVPEEKCLFVKNTREAYYQLAAAYRLNLSIPIIGITGSVGKTSVKEMTAAALSAIYKVCKTKANLNNELGVCQTILSIEKTDQAAIIEMGIDHPGDMALLTQIVKPSVAIVTGIGISHLERMGSREGLFKEKMQISDGMKETDPLILNGDNDMLKEVSQWGHHPIFQYGLDSPEFAVYADNITENKEDFSTSFSLYLQQEKYSVKIPTIGKTGVQNALAACGVLCALNLPVHKGIEGLLNYEAVGMRQHIVRAGSVTVIEDCYNASPDSVKAAIELLAGMDSKHRKIAVLGDMLELGPDELKHHANMGEIAVKGNFDQIYFIGNLSKEAEKAAKELGVQEVFWYPETIAAASEIARQIQAEDTILLKASRALRFEQIAEAIYTIYPKND